jgi:predicted nucleotidyltransferase component of viral defense system
MPLHDRKIALDEIDQGLLKLRQVLLSNFANMKVSEKRDLNNKVNKLFVSQNKTQIVIEPNTILRGILYPPVKMHLCKRAEELMQLSVSNVPVLNHSELYAGKICAALDRQHPRDLFDIQVLYENSGLTEEIRQAFVIYVACNSRPIHELLKPNKLDITKLYAAEFEGMTIRRSELNDLLLARDQLIADISYSLSDNERQFLMSIKRA